MELYRGKADQLLYSQQLQWAMITNLFGDSS